MRGITPTVPRSADGSSTTLRRRLVLLFAFVLALGVLTPTAAFAAPGQLLVKDRVAAEQAGSVSVRVVLATRVAHKVAVSWKTVNGSAVAGQDYRFSTGRIRFPAGTKVRHVTVPIINDTLIENDETFKIRLFDTYRSRILDRVGVVTIHSEDVTSLPVLTVADDSAQEGDDLQFAVSLSKPATHTVTFDYVTADGTAEAGGDFTGVTAGKGTITVGAQATTLTVKSTEDSIAEHTEHFTVQLSNLLGAAFGDDGTKGTITDDDPGVSLSVADLSVTEGNDAEVVVSLNKAAGYDVKVEAATSNGTATAGTDFTAKDDVVTIPAGSTSAKFTVKTTADTTDEPDQTFMVDLAAPHDATIADAHAVVTILDNDAAPTVSIAGSASVVEGNHAVLAVTLSAKSEKTVTVTWSTLDHSATAAHDFTAVSGATLTFAPGDTNEDAAVVTLEGDGQEVDEWFFVRLDTATNATINTAHQQGEVKIAHNIT